MQRTNLQSFELLSIFFILAVTILTTLTEKHNEIAEELLVIRLRGNDAEAFNLLFHKYGNKLFSFALGYLKTKEDAEEIVQDVFLKVWKNRHTLDEHYSFSGFLFSIAYRTILNQIRKRKNEKVCLIELEKRNSDVHHGTEESIIYTALQQVSQVAIAGLPPRRKAIFQMVKEQNMSHKQVAEKLHISTKTVEAQMSEALKYLRRFLSLRFLF